MLYATTTSTTTATTTSSPPQQPAREHRRADVGERLLDGLESLVQRHRGLRGGASDIGVLHAELIAAEVAHELAMARSALRRIPAIAPAQAGPSDDDRRPPTGD